MFYQPTRRNFLQTAGLLAGATVVNRRSLWAQDPVPAVIVQGRAAGATAKISVRNLRGPVSVLMGSGGNIAVLTGKDGKVLVDSGYSTSKPQITEALASLTADPLTHLINTHWHFDHTDGNEWMHGAGATIVAQQKTKERLSTPQEIAAFNAHFPAAPVAAIPAETFAERLELKLNGEVLQLEHYAPAHTDTDAWIYFSHADVLHTGDTWFNGFYPFIDYSSNGSIDGMIAAADKTLKLVTPKTIIIPGHGPVGDRAGLDAYQQMLIAIRGKVADLKKQGKTLEETVAAKPSADYDSKWGGGFLPAPAFLALVYQGV